MMESIPAASAELMKESDFHSIYAEFPFYYYGGSLLLRLNIRRRNPSHVYVDCPLCGDRRGKMNLNPTWHCDYCGKGGVTVFFQNNCVEETLLDYQFR